MIITLHRRLRPILGRIRAGGDQGDRGSVLVWLLGCAAVAGALLTLVFDGGAKIKAGEQASTYSAEAARAASVAVGPSTTDAAADVPGAIRAAKAYLAAAGVPGTVTVTGPATVTVTATVSRAAPISGVTFTITRTATARLLVGVEQGEAP